MKEFRTPHGTFKCGDALQLIEELGEGTVDCVITDPPFGLGMDEYDDMQVFFEIGDKLWKVLKKDAWLVFYFTTKKLLEVAKLRRFKFVWMLCCLSPSTISKTVLGDRSYTPIMVFKKGNPKVVYRRSDIVYADELPLIQAKVKDPQFKPTMATASLLQMFTKPDDLILDPFAGYGSIPLVCEIFGRKWVAFEIDPFKFEIARKFNVERETVDIKALRQNKNQKLPFSPLFTYATGGGRGKVVRSP